LETGCNSAYEYSLNSVFSYKLSILRAISGCQFTGMSLKEARGCSCNNNTGTRCSSARREHGSAVLNQALQPLRGEAQRGGIRGSVLAVWMAAKLLADNVIDLLFDAT
jgi:hypothetical protein